MPSFTVFSFWIEILAAKKVSRALVFALIFINILALLTFPLVLSFAVETDYLVGCLLFMYTVCTCLKLVSFHHTMHDVRGLVLRAIKARDAGSELKPSLVEGTVLGVNKMVFDEALTYPKCLSVKHFFRFMIAPTFCYQLIFPMMPKRNPKMICYRLL